MVWRGGPPGVREQGRATNRVFREAGNGSAADIESPEGSPARGERSESKSPVSTTSAGFGSPRRNKIPDHGRASRQWSPRKKEASVVSDAERNAKAREMDRGSLSIFIVAVESRGTIPRKSVSSKGGCRGNLTTAQ